jgi:hypothetical protein
MTNYNLKAIIPRSLAVQQKREQRRKVLEAVWERRKKTYKRFQKKMQLRNESDVL